MSSRAQNLADSLSAATDDVIAFAASAPDEVWARVCPGEQCTVAALACHLGFSTAGILDSMIAPTAEGRDAASFSPEALNAWNAQNAKDNADQTREFAIGVLREQGDRAVAYVRALSDEQLDRTRSMPFSPEPVSTESLIEMVLIGHPQQHLASMRAAAQ